MTQSNQKDELVAYIDLLAFSNYIRENTQDALSAFTTYHNILKTKIIDNKTHPISSYQSQNLQELAKIQAVTSVDYFLPFSDSIFLKSADPNLFVKQISSFLVGCFIYTSHAYAHPENVTKPTEVTQSAIDGSLYTSNWYPTLFRGAISIGEVIPIETLGVVNGDAKLLPCLVGRAVVECVKLESKVKGPRLVLTSETLEKLGNDTKDYVCETEINGLYEVLWPSFHYIKSNGKIEISKFDELFDPAVNLWKAYSHTQYSSHYFCFLRLIASSTIRFFELIREKNIAINAIQKSVEKHQIVEKLSALIGS